MIQLVLDCLRDMNEKPLDFNGRKSVFQYSTERIDFKLCEALNSILEMDMSTFQKFCDDPAHLCETLFLVHANIKKITELINLRDKDIDSLLKELEDS